MIAQVEARGWEGSVWHERGAEYFCDALAGYASAIEQDFVKQREKLVSGSVVGGGIPKQMVRSRLERWDLTLGKERIAWTVACRELRKLGDGQGGQGGQGFGSAEEVVREACRLWLRAVGRHDARPKILEV